jgi:hypothetical protein
MAFQTMNVIEKNIHRKDAQNAKPVSRNSAIIFFFAFFAPLR